MTKCELIDKKEFLKQIDTINLSEFNRYYILNGLDKAKVTEQDIVKPYIEAIKAEEIKYKGTRQVEIQAYADGLYKAIEIINNLLSQEVKNEL